MGGAYLTLLITIANMGIILPKLAIFALMDWLTERECVGAKGDPRGYICPTNRKAAEDANPCTAAGGLCVIKGDGYYPLSYGMIVFGLVLGI